MNQGAGKRPVVEDFDMLAHFGRVSFGYSHSLNIAHQSASI